MAMFQHYKLLSNVVHDGIDIYVESFNIQADIKGCFVMNFEILISAWSTTTLHLVMDPTARWRRDKAL